LIDNQLVVLLYSPHLNRCRINVKQSHADNHTMSTSGSRIEREQGRVCGAPL
jgi:hypothetical protein